MERNISVDLGQLILSFSDSMDLTSPELIQHQQRVAFIVWEMAMKADLSSERLENLFIAALLHDIGAFSMEEKVELFHVETVNTDEHCIRGQKMLRQISSFRKSAKLVRYHHTAIKNWQESIYVNHVYDSQILFLADFVERQIPRDDFILFHNKKIIEEVQKLSGSDFHPQIVELFLEISHSESFWLDLLSNRLYSTLQNGPFRQVNMNLETLLNISDLFRNIIDLRSRFTSTHSAGVATAASALAEKFGFTNSEIKMIRIAGNLHDIGKLAIPNNVLNKPEKLTRKETQIMKSHTYFTFQIINKIKGLEQIAYWAAYHHEKLDGSGYPFHYAADQLSINARVMAIADIFTALLENRPYRKGMGQKDIVRIMHQFADRNLIDAKLVRLLLFNYDEISSEVLLQQQQVKDFYETQFAIKTLN